MFTGIIKEQALVKQVDIKPTGLTLVISSPHKTLPVGSSLAINGVCATVAARSKTTLTFFFMPESLRLTTMLGLKKGDRVNIEAPLTLTKPLGGHMVQGHVDYSGRLTHITSDGDSLILTISVPDTTLVVAKGSIAVDGISLTVTKVTAKMFTVNIIPHTWQSTTLKTKKIGDHVNIEFDIMGKYVFNFIEKYATQPKK